MLLAARTLPRRMGENAGAEKAFTLSIAAAAAKQARTTRIVCSGEGGGNGS